MRDDGSIGHVFREGRARERYRSAVGNMRSYIAEIKSLGEQTRPFEILLDSIIK